MSSRIDKYKRIEHTAKEIVQKAKKVMGMLKRGVKFTPTQLDVRAILEKLQQGK